MSPDRPPLLRVVALLLAALAAAACDAGGEDADPPARSDHASPAAPHAPPPTSPVGEALPEDLAGTWWAYVPERPHLAFRVTLVPAAAEGRWGGSWVSFDWRGTAREEELHRVSKPVEIQAERTGARIVVRGPAPQIDARTGQPTGARGDWELRLERQSLPGEPLRFAGRLVHSEKEGDTGMPAEVSAGFRVWGE